MFQSRGQWKRKMIMSIPEFLSLTISSYCLRKPELLGTGPEGRNPEETEYKPTMTKKALKPLDLLEMSVSNIYFFNLTFIFLLYNTVLVLPYIDMDPPQVYMSSQP